jgi:hypothetical protein
VLNQSLTSQFSVRPLSTDDKALSWISMNFSDVSDKFVPEKLAARFRSVEVKTGFQEAIASCVLKLSNLQG